MQCMGTDIIADLKQENFRCCDCLLSYTIPTSHVFDLSLGTHARTRTRACMRAHTHTHTHTSHCFVLLERPTHLPQSNYMKVSQMKIIKYFNT
jgi:hypothetical protein